MRNVVRCLFFVRCCQGTSLPLVLFVGVMTKSLMQLFQQFDFVMQLLDSRASRMSPNQALISLHADYIGGHNANYRRWYFVAQLDLDDAVGQIQHPGVTRIKSTRCKRSLHEKSVATAIDRWRDAMNSVTQYDRLRQIALYLLCWGEAAQVRFAPECLCYVFKCADDYYRSPECQQRMCRKAFT
jgi:1,3-beta-glucan synthase